MKKTATNICQILCGKLGILAVFQIVCESVYKK
jgi:hypothetical protein